MHFLQPVFLWALPALLIPVLLHLFNLQRTEKVIFSNTRMLENLVKQTSKARNLRHILLLILRLLAFACIILAFAQPVFSDRSANPDDAFVSAAVYVDDSFSMDLREENGTALERAIAFAAAVPGVFPEKGWYRLNRNTEQSGKTWTSPAGFKDQLMEIQKTPSQKSPLKVLRQTYQQLALRKSEERKHVYLISDFQKEFWDIPGRNLLDTSIIHHFVPVVHSSVQNVWIDTAWENLSGGNPGKVEVKFRVRSSGLKNAQVLRVQLYEGSNLQAGRQLELIPGQAQVSSFMIQQKIQTTRCLRLEVDDPSLAWDNRFYLALKSPDPYLVYRLGDQANPVLQKLFRSSPAFRYSEGSLQNPDYDVLEKCKLIVLDKPDMISKGLAARLLDLAEAGASICIIPSQKTANVLNTSGLLEVPVKELPSADAGTLKGKILLPDASSSFFRNVFSNQGKNPALPENRSILDLRGVGLSLLGFESGHVFLSRITKGQGSFFLFGNDPGALDFSFHRHPLMLAAFYRMASALQEMENNPLFVSKNQNRTLLKPDSGLQAGEGQVEMRNGSLKIQAGLGMSGNRPFLQTDFKQLAEGFWEVWQNNRKVDVLALNRDPGESELNFYSADELKSILPDRPWIIVSEIGAEEKTEHLKAGLEQGMPIWKWFILVAIFFLIAESFVNRKMALAGRSL